MASTEFHDRLVPAAYGIHHMIVRSLSDLFEGALRHTCFSFYEYVLENPITVFDDYAADIRLSNQRVAAPYLRRFAHQKGVMPAVNSANPLGSLAGTGTTVNMVPYTPDNVEEFWKGYDCARLDLQEPHFLRGLLNHWQFGTDTFDFPCAPKHHEFQKVDGVSCLTCVFDANVLATLPRNLATAFNTRLAKLTTDAARQELKDLTAVQLREYALTIMPFLAGVPDRDVCVCAFSLSSRSVFWGDCFVIFPLDQPVRVAGTRVDYPEGVTKFLSRLCQSVTKTITDTYVPVLTLLKNSLEESQLRQCLANANVSRRTVGRRLFDSLSMACRTLEARLKTLGTGTWQHRTAPARFGRAIDLSGFVWLFLRLTISACKCPSTQLKALESMEKRLIELWADRLWRVPHVRMRAQILDTLFFERYHVASPALMASVKDAINLHHSPSGNGVTVTTALVVGGSGSGKDTMAKLIWLFSPGFRFGKLRTFNMAMFRPKEAAVPLLLGLDLEGDGTGRAGASALRVKLKGLLFRALSLGVRAGERNRGATFILDELNSLDMDTQGALLRFLENAELTPLGGLANVLKDSLKSPKGVLVVGVMNEDPHLIMKRQAMDRVLQQGEMFGSILGQTLHEMLRNQRRLRDDLYYRLIRGGEIVLPDLRDREEDLPGLFYDHIARLCETMLPDGVSRFEVDLSVYEELMNPGLGWEGNLRELQTLARNALLEAKADFESAIATIRASMAIRGIHIRRALRRGQESRVGSRAIH